jgi:2-oxoglutarate ferredoxin oxidoreductase subunit delta
MTEETKPKEEAKIDIYRAWCKACGICVAFCPTGALAKDEAGNPYVNDAGKCIECGWCEIRCPDFAISVEKKTKRGKRKDAGAEEARVEGKAKENPTAGR